MDDRQRKINECVREAQERDLRRLEIEFTLGRMANRNPSSDILEEIKLACPTFFELRADIENRIALIETEFLERRERLSEYAKGPEQLSVWLHMEHDEMRRTIGNLRRELDRLNGHVARILAHSPMPQIVIPGNPAVK